MINLVAPVENIVLEAGDKLANDAVKIAKGNAPVDSGRLQASINTYKTSKYSWLVLTDAVGSNGFEYPARIEAGEAVYPRPGNKRGLYYHGTWHSMASASAQSGFMKDTMGMLHI